MKRFKNSIYTVVLALSIFFGITTTTFAFYEDEPARKVDTVSAINFIDGKTNYLGGIALDDQGKVWTWGWNGLPGSTDHGMLGIEDESGKTSTKFYAGGMIRVPYFVEQGIHVESIEAGYHSNFALDDQGQVYAWGRGIEGQIGNGASKPRNPKPINISTIDGSPLKGKKIVKLSASSEAATSVFALDDQGNVYAWGYNAVNMFPGVTGGKNLPVELVEIKNIAGNIVDISAGRLHGIVLNDQGELFVWGDNTFGQHGNGKIVGNSLEKVDWFSNHSKQITMISAKSDINTVVTTDNEVYQFGQMVGSINSKEPIQIEYDLSNVSYIPIPKAITSGKLVSYIIDQNGRLWSWGNNNYYGFFLDGPWYVNQSKKSNIAKIQPDHMGDGNTEAYANEIKAPIFSSKTKPVTTLTRYETLGKWSNINDLHPTVYDKKYMRTTGDFSGKDKSNHSKVFPVDKEDRRLVYTVQRIKGMYETNFLVADDSYAGNWFLDISGKEGTSLPHGLTSEKGSPEVKESEKSWIGLSVDLDKFDYTANPDHMNSVPYMRSIHTFQSGSILIDSSGNLYKSSLDGSGSIAWGWDVNYAYDKGFSTLNPQDGLYDLYNYELTFMRGAPRVIPGNIDIRSKKEKRYLSDETKENIEMKIDIGTAYQDEQLNIKVEPELKQLKMVSMPYDENSSEFSIESPTYDEFMDAYNNSAAKGFEVSDIAVNNGWEGIKHELGQPPIETLVDKSIEISDNSVVWIMLQTQGYSNYVTTTKRVIYDNFYTDQEVKTAGALLKDENKQLYEPRTDNISKVTEDKYPEKVGFPLDKSKNVIVNPTFGYDELSVKRISDDVLDQLPLIPKFSHHYNWAKNQAEEKKYVLDNSTVQNNRPVDIAESTGKMPYNGTNQLLHKFYYEENPDIFFDLHYVAVDKNGDQLPVDEFSLPSEIHLLKEVELSRTVPELNINKKLLPNKYVIEYSAPKNTVDVTNFKNLPTNKSFKFTIPYDKTIKDVTLYYLYDELERDVTLNIRQIIQGKSKVEVPKVGYISYQKANDKWEKQQGINQVKVPSNLESNEVSYKTIKTKVNKDSSRFVLKDIIPQYYEYIGFKQSDVKDSNQSSQLKSDKEIHVDYSDDSTEKWVTVFLKGTSDDPLNYSWDTVTNNFGKLPTVEPKKIRIKFYGEIKGEKTPAKLVDLKTYGGGILSDYYDNLDAYYMRFEIPNIYKSKKFKSSEVIEDIVLEQSKVNTDELPKEISLNYYYTDASGNEIESIVPGFGAKYNGIGNPNIIEGHIGLGDMKGKMIEIDKDSNPNEILIRYKFESMDFAVMPF